MPVHYPLDVHPPRGVVGISDDEPVSSRRSRGQEQPNDDCHADGPNQDSHRE